MNKDEEWLNSLPLCRIENPYLDIKAKLEEKNKIIENKDEEIQNMRVEILASDSINVNLEEQIQQLKKRIEELEHMRVK